MSAGEIQAELVERCIALVLGKTHTATADLWVLNDLIRSVAAQLVQSKAWPGARPAPMPEQLALLPQPL